MTQDLPRAGWYPDPADPTGRRYWDGQRWTEHTLAGAWDRPATPAEEPQPSVGPDGEYRSAAPAEATGSEVGVAGDETQPGSVPDVPSSSPAEPVPPSEPAPPPEPTSAAEAPAGEPADALRAGEAVDERGPLHEPVPQPEPVSQPAPAGPGGWEQAGFTVGSPATAAPPYPGYETYLPQTAPLTSSGMRRVAAMFSDMGRILKRAWWQIIVVSLALWVAWTLIVTAITATLVDFGRLADAMNLAVSAANDYPNGRYPEEVADQIRESFEAVPRTSSVSAWVLIMLLVVLLYGLAASLQVVAVNRLGMDAAAGRPVRLALAVRSGAVGGLRLFGYYLLLTVLITAVALLIALLLAATSSVPPLLALLIMLVLAGFVVATLFLIGRLAPITAQVALGRGALGWSWRATRTKFWGVLGRYLLWALVAGIIGQVVLSIVSIPFFLASTASLAASPMEITPAVVLTWVVMMVLSLVISAITYVGIVPIWRDLTDDPDYRSIADGEPLPDPRG